MKKIFTLFVAAMAAVNMFAAWSGSGQGVLVDGQWYALYETDEKSLFTIATGDAMQLSAPGQSLSYDAKGSNSLTGAGAKYFYYSFSTDGGSNWTDISQNLTTSYTTYSASLSVDVDKIRFLTKLGSTLTKYYKNVKVSMATYLEAPSVSSLDFGQKTMPIEPATESLTFTLPWCNTEVSAVLAGEGAEHISVSSDVTAEAGHYATSTYTVSYDRSVISSLNATLTITGADQTYIVAITGETVPPTTYGEYSASACAGDTIEFNGVSYTESFSGAVTLAEKNILGGDSVVNLTIIFHSLDTTILEAKEVVVGTEVEIFGENHVFVELGDTVFYLHLNNQFGCDSVLVQDVHVVCGSDTTILEPMDAFVGVEVEIFGEYHVFEAAGDTTLYQTLTNQYGCDSVLVQNVHVTVPTPTAIDHTMVAPAAEKFFRQGRIYIRRGEALYDMSGRKVK